MEFSAILVSQLESQRLYFDSQLEAITNESTVRTAAIESELQKSKAAVDKLENKVSSLIKEKNALTHKLAVVSLGFQMTQKSNAFQRKPPLCIVPPL